MTTSRPFSLEIMAGPVTWRISASWPSGTWTPFGAGDGHAAERLRARAVLGRVPHPHREALAALDGQGEVRLADRGLDDVLDGADRDPVARRRLPVHPDVEVGGARHLLGVDVGGPRNRAQHLRHGPRPFLEHLQVVAEDLHADLGADAGRQHVDPVDDRLRPDVGRRRAASWPRPARRSASRASSRAATGRSGLRFTMVSVMFTGAGSVEVSAREILATTPATSGTGRMAAFCFLRDLDRLGQRDGRIGDRHEHQVALVQRRHELLADAGDEGEGARQARARPPRA